MAVNKRILSDLQNKCYDDISKALGRFIRMGLIAGENKIDVTLATIGLAKALGRIAEDYMTKLPTDYIEIADEYCNSVFDYSSVQHDEALERYKEAQAKILQEENELLQVLVDKLKELGFEIEESSITSIGGNNDSVH